MVSAFFDSRSPITGTLAHWVPKCNAEMEIRVRLDFEVPLTAELLSVSPANIQRAAAAIGTLADGLTGGPISSEFEQTFELYTTPDHKTPAITLSNVRATNLYMFRPTPKDGPSGDLFLTFSTNVKADGPYGVELVSWALPMIRKTVFFRTFDVQGTLPLTEEKMPSPAKRKSGKDAAASSED